MAKLSQKMLNHVHVNPNFLRIYIFYEVMKNDFNQPNPTPFYRTVFNTFNKLVKKFGDNAMDYQEFEFWYMRFSRAEFGINYDRSADPPSRSFTDLPVHIVQQILQDFNFSEKLHLRKVCKPLQSLIDTWKPAIENIEISNDSNGIRWHFDGKQKLSTREYYQYDDNYNEEPFRREEPIDERSGNSVLRKGNSRHGFLELKAVLGNPKLKLNSLKITKFDISHVGHFQEIFNFLNGAQIHVENLKIPRNSVYFDVIRIIQHLKPKVLKEVDLDIFINENEEHDFNILMNRIGRSEQLKKVKMLRVGSRIGWYTQPFHCFLECPRVTVDVTFGMAAMEVGLAVKTLVKSTVLEMFYIKMDQLSFNVNTIMRQFEGPQFLEVDDRPNVRRHRIPDSDQFYEIEVTEKMIRIERMP